jgi:hypothetical protein
MRRKASLIALVVGCLLIAAGVVLWFSTLLAPASFPVEDIKRVERHYLTTSVGRETKIFLMAAAPSYGVYPYPSVTGKGSNPDIHTGDPCLIINVTVRNDYTRQDPPPIAISDMESQCDAFTALTATLFDKDSKGIEATNVTPEYPAIPPQLGAPTIHLESGEIYSFSMYLATPNRTVNRFNIKILYVSSLPAT